MINRVHIKGNIVFFGTEKKQYRKLEWLERIAISFLARYIPKVGDSGFGRQYSGKTR